MTTARDIIKASLRKIAVLGTGSPLDATEANDALMALNAMIASWSVEGNLVFTETIEEFPLSNLNGEYTIGIGGDFNTTRPTKIVAAYVSLGDTDYTMEKYGQIQYAELAFKQVSGGVPEVYYYNAGFPLGTIRLYPLPSGVTSITLYTEKVLDGFTDLDTEFAMPAEYEAALTYNLAIWIAGEYEREPMMSVVNIANQTKRTIESQNKRNDKVISDIDAPSRGGRDRSIILRGYR